MKKRVLSLTLAFAIVISILPSMAWAGDQTLSDDNLIVEEPMEIVEGAVTIDSLDILGEQYSSDTQTLFEAKEAAEAVLSELTVTNDTEAEEIMNAVESIITNPSIIAAWTSGFYKTDATSSEDGYITGEISLTDADDYTIEIITIYLVINKLEDAVLTMVPLISAATTGLTGDDGTTNWDFIEPATHQTTVPNGYIGIYTAQDLDNVRNNLSGNYILMNDIDLSAWGDWEPIGKPSNPFRGLLNGNGYVISNITIISPNEYIGLIGYSDMAGILNIGLVDVNIDISISSESINCLYAGGILGYFSSQSSITNCYSSGRISIHTSTNIDIIIGGIVGVIAANEIDNCYNLSEIVSSSDNSKAGGIVGSAGGSSLISNCYNTGEIQASYAGGIICDASASATFFFNNCTNSGKIKASTYAGGIVGITGLITTGSGTTSNSTISFCNNENNIEASSLGAESVRAGGIVGSGPSTIANCNNYGKVSVSAEAEAYVGGITGYPSLSYITDSSNAGDIEGTSKSIAYVGGITSGGPFLITAITNCYNSGKVSVSAEAEAYVGGITGISNLGENADNSNAGEIEGTSKSIIYAGGIVGYSILSVVEDINNCTNKGKVITSATTSYTGGIVGYSVNKVNNCINEGEIITSAITSYTGGIAGYGSSVSNSFSKNNLTGTVVGGILGNSSDKTIIENCSSESDAIGSKVGGILGNASSKVTVTNCTSTGNISLVSVDDGDSYAGGMVGYADTGSQITFKPDCFYSSSNLDPIGGGNGTIIGLENVRHPNSIITLTEKTYTAEVGEEIYISGTVISTTLTVTSDTITWSCSDPSAVIFGQMSVLWMIDEAVISIPVMCNKAGSYTITVTAEDGATAKAALSIYSSFNRLTDVWSFANSNDIFTDGYKMEDNIRDYLLSTLTWTEKLRVYRKNFYYDYDIRSWVYHAPWSGSCFGMSATVALFHRDELTTKYWSDEADTVFNIGYNTSSRNLINYYQTLLQTESIMTWYNFYKNKTTEEQIGYIEDFMKYGDDGLYNGKPYVVDLGFSFINEGNAKGHNILLYGEIETFTSDDDEEEGWNVSGIYYQHRIRTYDPSWPDIETYFYYTSDKENILVFGYKNTQIDFIIPSPLLAENLDEYNPEKVYLRNTLFNSNNIEEDRSNLLQVYGLVDIVITTCSGKSATVNNLFVDGDLSVYPFFDQAAATDVNYEICDINILIPNNDDIYTISSAQYNNELDISMSYANYLSACLCSSGNNVTFGPDGFVSANMINSDYTLLQVYNDGYYNIPWHTITVSGENANIASLERIGDNTIFTCDNMYNIVVTGENEFETIIMTFSTDEEKVLLKAEDDILIAYIDTDGDGIYATPIASSEKSNAQCIITATVGTGGSISPSGSVSVNEGGSQTFTITANSGYRTSNVLVDGQSVGAVSSYTFDNVTADHTISASFTKISISSSNKSSSSGSSSSSSSSTDEDSSGSNTGSSGDSSADNNTVSTKISFSDVSEADWFCDSVAFVVEKGLFDGMGDGTFAPNEVMTREMFVTVLGRIAETLGVSTIGYTNPFFDVQDGMWYSNYIAWGAANGLVEGYDENTFGLGRSITREQMATLLVRFADYVNITLGGNASVQFTDAANIRAYAKDAVDTCSKAGLLNGYDDGTFRPSGNATRAEVATIFMRFMKQYITG